MVIAAFPVTIRRRVGQSVIGGSLNIAQSCWILLCQRLDGSEASLRLMNRMAFTHIYATGINISNYKHPSGLVHYSINVNVNVTIDNFIEALDPF